MRGFLAARPQWEVVIPAADSGGPAAPGAAPVDPAVAPAIEQDAEA